MPWRGPWGDPPLSEMVHASYNTHKAVEYHIHRSIIILLPLTLHGWWGPWFNLLVILVPISMVTAEHVWGVVGSHALVCLLIQACQMWWMPHMTLINGRIACPFRYHHPWTTTLLMRYIVQPLGSKNQGNIWACLGCSLWSYGGLCGDPSLLHIVQDSYDTHKMVGYHTHTCVIILGQLHYWWGPWFNLLVQISRVTA